MMGALLEKYIGFFFLAGLFTLTINHRYATVFILILVLLTFLLALKYKNDLIFIDSRMMKIILWPISTGLLLAALQLVDGAPGSYDFAENALKISLILSPAFILAKSKIDEKNILLVLAAMSFSIGISAFLSVYIFDNDRAGFLYSHPLPIGNLAAECVIFLTYLLSDQYAKRSAYIKFLSFVAIGAALFALILSGTKGAWLVAFIGVGFVLYKQRKLLTPAFNAILFILLFLLGFISNEKFMPRIGGLMVGVGCVLEQSEVCSDGGTVSSRADMIKVGLNGWVAEPFLGKGPDEFIVDLKNAADEGRINYASYHSPLNAHPHNNPHNDLVFHLYGYGLFGALGYISLLGFTLFYVKRRKAVNFLWGNLLYLHVFITFLLGISQSVFSVSSQVLQYALFLLLFLSLHFKEESSAEI